MRRQGRDMKAFATVAQCRWHRIQIVCGQGTVHMRQIVAKTQCRAFEHPGGGGFEQGHKAVVREVSPIRSPVMPPQLSPLLTTNMALAVWQMARSWAGLPGCDDLQLFSRISDPKCGTGVKFMVRQIRQAGEFPGIPAFADPLPAHKDQRRYPNPLPAAFARQAQVLPQKAGRVRHPRGAFGPERSLPRGQP